MEYNKKERLLDIIKGFTIINPNKYESWYNKGIDDVYKRTEKLFDEELITELPQFVADWLEYCKNIWLSLARALAVSEEDFYNYGNKKDYLDLLYFLGSMVNQEKFALAWVNGYEVNKEKRYLVKIIGIIDYNSYLNYHKENNKWTIETSSETGAIRTKHTRKELEEAGFGDVFNSPLFEVEEVE